MDLQGRELIQLDPQQNIESLSSKRGSKSEGYYINGVDENLYVGKKQQKQSRIE